MPKTKNALLRYFFLDQLLSDKDGRYTCLDLVIKCNSMLIQAGYPGICKDSAASKDDVSPAFSKDYKSAKRLIQLDLVSLQDAPFNMEIDSTERYKGAPVYRYKDTSRTLFSRKFSKDEKYILKEVLNTLGEFSGVDTFNWLDDLQKKLNNNGSLTYFKRDSKKTLICFDDNKYLKNKNYLAHLFSHILHRRTIDVEYKRFYEDNSTVLTVFPYRLKQYRNRWYLICTPSTDINTGGYDPELIYNLPIDRFVDKVKVNRSIPFKNTSVDIDSRYEEVVGVTYYKDNPVEKVIFAVKTDISDSALPYIETKPLHETQTQFFDPKYQIKGCKTFFIECRYNYELLSLLMSFGNKIVVLSPAHIRDKIIAAAKSQLSDYNKYI